MLILGLYLLQTLIGTFVWKRILFTNQGEYHWNVWYLSIIFSGLVVPNLIILIVYMLDI